MLMVQGLPKFSFLLQTLLVGARMRGDTNNAVVSAHILCADAPILNAP
jgi:hypothetical protein